MKRPVTRFTLRGFTLIELLVVIAIIGLLAAILFPVFSQARENARRSTCQSNLKQISLGLMQYEQDFDQMIPACVHGSNSFSTLIDPYVKSGQVWKCPSDKANKVTNGRSYALNVRIGNTRSMGQTVASPLDWRTTDTVGGYGQSGLLTAKITDTTGTILVSERPSNVNYLSTSNMDIACPDNPGGSGQGTGTCRVGVSPTYGAEQTKDVGFGTTPFHQEGWNYLFVDGHVKWLLPMKTVGKQGGTYCTSTPNISSPCGMWTEDPNDNS